MARVAVAYKPEGLTEYEIDPAVYNRVAVKGKPTMIPRSCNCMASQCGMWRWGPAPSSHQIKHPDPEAQTQPAERPDGVGEDWEFIPHDTEESSPAYWLEPMASAEQKRRRGYCGLAPLHPVAA